MVLGLPEHHLLDRRGFKVRPEQPDHKDRKDLLAHILQEIQQQIELALEALQLGFAQQT
jgi:hypothetical protein